MIISDLEPDCEFDFNARVKGLCCQTGAKVTIKPGDGMRLIGASADYVIIQNLMNSDFYSLPNIDYDIFC